MHLKINLATRTYLDMRRVNIALAGMVALFAVMLFFAVRGVATNAGEIARLEKEARAAEANTKGKVDEREYQRLTTKIGAANEIIERKSYRWIRLLDELEQVVPEGVAITSLDPDAKNGVLRISGVATSFAGVRKLMENLEGTKFFTETFLLGQSEAKVGLNQQGTTFQVTCKVSFI